MSGKLRNIFALVFVTITFAVVNADAQNRAYTATDSQVQYLLNRIETRTDTFLRNMNTALDRSSLNNTDSEELVINYISDFENATDALKEKFTARRSVDADVQDVLNRAADINQFLKNNRLTTTVQSDWTAIRTDVSTLARYYGVTFDWNTVSNNNNNTNNNTRAYTAADSQVLTLLARIDVTSERYRQAVGRSFNRNSTNNSDEIYQYISDFESETDMLRGKFDSRTSMNSDVSNLLGRAMSIENFMRSNRLNQGAQREWTSIKNDLNTLAGYYNVSWNWNNTQQNNNNNTRADLNGTYRLNTAQSDNVSDIVDNATNKYYSGNQRDRVKTNLERRLTPPSMLAIEKSGQQITVGSDMAQQVSFTADGVARTETNNNGRSVKITAAQSSGGVTLNYEGDRMNDFYVSFMPMSNGQLKVMRRVYLENRNETVTVTSVYDKTSPTAQWSAMNNNQNTSNNVNDSFIVPNNTKITAVTQSLISTKINQDGDRFQMLVTSPSQYDGAIIEGYIAKTERSGRVSGSANMSLVLETIKLRNGQTYRFSGLVDEIRRTNGDTVAVNNEGTVKDGSQTKKTVTRGAIGAGLGAIIGAIAGGGKGAAIGAAIGGGAGAGSVLIQGKDDVELESGTEFLITSSAPSNLNSFRFR